MATRDSNPFFHLKGASERASHIQRQFDESRKVLFNFSPADNLSGEDIEKL